MNSRVRPSGDQRGSVWSRESVSGVSRTACPPSRSPTKITSFRTNASRVPSGDQAGHSSPLSNSSGSGGVVSFRMSLPPAPML